MENTGKNSHTRVVQISGVPHDLAKKLRDLADRKGQTVSALAKIAFNDMVKQAETPAPARP
jgi:hypothetical protein